MLYPSLITNTQEVYDGGNKNTGRQIWWSSASVDRQKDNWGTSLFPTNLQEWNMAIAPWWFQEDHNWTCPGNDWKGKHLATKITKCYQNFASPLPIIAEEQPNVWSNYYYNWRCLKYRVRHFSLCPQHAQMAESEVETLVCPFSIWPGQGFYIELFVFDTFASE